MKFKEQMIPVNYFDPIQIMANRSKYVQCRTCHAIIEDIPNYRKDHRDFHNQISKLMEKE